MSIDQAIEFLKLLSHDEELKQKMSGFTLDELKIALEMLTKNTEISKEELEQIIGGSGIHTILPDIFSAMNED